MKTNVALDVADLLVSEAEVIQTSENVSQAMKDGDALSVIAGTSSLIAAIPGPQQLGSSVTSIGLNAANVTQKINSGDVQSSEVLSLSSAVVSGLAALGVIGVGVLSVPEILAASLFAGAYGWLSGSDEFNDFLQDSSDWFSSGQYEDDIDEVLDYFSDTFIEFGLGLGDTINDIEDAVNELFSDART